MRNSMRSSKKYAVPDVVSFRIWAYDQPLTKELPVNGDYSRAAWLPVLGPTSWLLWGTVTLPLLAQPEVTWPVDELADAHGVGRLTDAVGRTLGRLISFGIMTPAATDHSAYAVRATCPPLYRRQLARAPEWVQSLHATTWDHDTRQPEARSS